MSRPTMPSLDPEDLWGLTFQNAVFDVSDRLDTKFSAVFLEPGDPTSPGALNLRRVVPPDPEEPQATPKHSIFGVNNPPVQVFTFTDGGNAINLACNFYRTNTPINTDNWRIVGGRVWVPPTATGLGPLTIWHLVSAATELPSLADAAASPYREIIASPIPGQWNEVFFDTPRSGLAVAQYCWIGYTFGNGTYFYGNAMAAAAIQSADGSPIYMAGNGESRSVFGNGNTGSMTAVSTNAPWYGIDVIWDEGP